MNRRAKPLIAGLITIVAGTAALQLITGFAGIGSFPFDGCLSPLWESSRYSCLAEIARRTNKPIFCKLLLPDRDFYVGCITAVALFDKSASICIQWLASDQTLKEDAGAHLCLKNVEDGLKDR